MEKILLSAMFVLLLFSCGEQKKDNQVNENDETQQDVSLESIAKSHIQSTLGIPVSENFSYKIYKEHLDGDDKIDAIVTVNRLEFAMKEAAESDRTAKQGETGFMGHYNYFYYYDGALKQLSQPMLIASSALSDLKVDFVNITSDAFKDVTFDFKVMDGSFKDFYTISNHQPSRIFQWKNYVGLKNSESEAYYFTYSDGTMGPSKDILIMKGELIQPSGDINIFTYDPEIKKTDELVLRFFYHSGTGKYMTKPN